MVDLWVQILPPPGPLGEDELRPELAPALWHNTPLAADMPLPLRLDRNNDVYQFAGTVTAMRPNLDGSLDAEIHFELADVPNDEALWYATAHYEQSDPPHLLGVILTHTPVDPERQLPFNRAILEPAPEAEAEAEQPTPRRGRGGR